ncbi:hypothetical protein FXV83_16305 [Bradyrhizobium hipponense]|uniref:Uncharacterized protein n=1 Tax=Bradyrhizobium hipponense TaxID=2605638 RepID=A0A5S4YPY5_9BRAD|nr:hypothetical protein [Bradyrhizobium hipponense]TYO65497.1 hypothetical protein FXV83_16305 [Bradyrhizobium hipponense]
MSVPDELVDLALEALEAEVACWRKVPWRPDYTRLMRFSDTCRGPVGPAEVTEEEATITCHDVPTHMADDMIVRFAMEKVVEAVIGAISVGGE